MKQVEPPPRNLVLKDLFGDTTLRVAHSNQGDPYRNTLVLTFERGAHGSYERYEHLASIELEGDEERDLRDLLNDRAKRFGL